MVADDEEDDDVGDAEENDVAVMKLKAEGLIFILHRLKGGKRGYQERTERLDDISVCESKAGTI